MPEGVNYDVNAYLRTQGSFSKDVAKASRGADQLGNSWTRAGDKMVMAGDRIRGSLGGVAIALGKAGVMAGFAGLAGGVGLAAREGVKFNDQMEQGKLGLATMYSTFGLASGEVDVMSGKMTEFAKSTEIAEGMQKRLFDIAKASPATFEDINEAYMAMAPGVTGITKDLGRQSALMEKMAVMAFTTGGDYKQLGMDVGRMVTGVAGADVAAFRTLTPVIKESFKEFEANRLVAEKKAPNLAKAYEKVNKTLSKGDFAAHFNKLAKADGEAALTIFEGALGGMSSEVNEAFGASFSGIMATVQSEFQVLTGKFGAPLMKSLTKGAKHFALILGGESTASAGLSGAAEFAGQQLARAADKLFERLEAGARFIADNWVMIAVKIQEAGVLAGAALKAAAVVATTKMVAGFATVAAGRGVQAAGALRGAGAGIGAAAGSMARRQHMTLGRGMKGGKGGGLTGMMGRGMGKIAGKGGGKDDMFGGVFRSIDKGVLKFATMGSMITAAAGAAGLLAVAFAGVVVVVGGMAAYIISNWETIKTSLVQGFTDGTITLIPLITSVYTFYERLKLVGEAILGGTDATTMMVSGLDLMTGAVDFAGTVLGGMIQTVAIMIGAWGALKLGMLAVMKVIMLVAELGAKIGAVDESAMASATANYQKFRDGIHDTFTKADKFSRAADAISKAKLDPLQIKAAQAKAKDLQQTLTDALSGKGKDKDKGRKKKAGVKIGKVEIVVNALDDDPDRLFAAFIPKLERMSETRVQSYDALPQGS